MGVRVTEIDRWTGDAVIEEEDEEYLDEELDYEYEDDDFVEDEDDL